MRISDVSSRRWSAAYGGWMVRHRWQVVAGWLVLLWAMSALLPDAPGSLEGGVESIVSADSPAIHTEVRSYQAFGFSLLSRTSVVQRDPDGLPFDVQARALRRGVTVSRGGAQDVGPIVAAVPIVNTFGLFPGSREANTTVITWLFMPPNVSFNRQYSLGRDFAERHYAADDHVVGVTGSVPARVEQGRVVNGSLSTVETVTLAAILLIVGVAFRSLIAPLVTAAVAAVGVFATLQLADAAGALLGVAVPSELEPLLVALLLGVVTDYVVFYLSGTRRALADGHDDRAAVQLATARFTPIVVVAGITVAAGTACLLIARSTLFRAFGPGMALTVAVGLVTAATLTPALLAILGSRAFWPHRPTPSTSSSQRLAAQAERRVGWLTERDKAAKVLAAGVAVLALLAMPISRLELGLAFVPSLPTDDAVRQAAIAAKAGFADGILSPTVVLVEGHGITDRRPQLADLEAWLKRQSGVAGVLGPADDPLDQEKGIVLAEDGDAARFLIVLSDDPLDAKAIDTVRHLRSALPAVLTGIGLTDARVGLAGDTAIAADVVADTTRDLLRIAMAALLVNLLLLVLFLRALPAPLCLLALNLLTLLSTLGLTTLVFHTALGHDGVTFYVPFAAAVLLVALGSDYTIFGVGHVWDEARHRPLREALVAAVPRTAWATTTAGFILAVSFGLLALVPLRPFRELAFAMSVGILLDAVLVRSLLVPSLLTLLSRAGGWPTHYLYDRRH